MSDSGDDGDTKKIKHPETYIRETEDSIVDLADMDAFSKITSKSNSQLLLCLLKQFHF